MSRLHRYGVDTVWTGAGRHGTRDHRSYGRDHRSSAEGRPDLLGSSDPVFRGDDRRWNPELLLSHEPVVEVAEIAHRG